MSRVVAFFRQPKNLPVLVIPLLLAFWAQFIAPEIGSASFTGVALFDSPYRDTLPFGEPAEAVTERVVILVVDGLREDISRQMPAINALREIGADRVVTVGQPSFSLPGWTVIGTGSWQEQNGVTTNFYEDPIAVDTLFASAKRAGLTTAIVGHEEWGQLYPADVDTTRYLVENDDAYTNVEAGLAYDRQTADLALEVLAAPANLTLIHLLSVDSMAHGFGALSPQAQQAVSNADAQIARMVAALDLSTTAVFVTADHGHVDRGGHGGWEEAVLRIPLVSAGQGILPGAYPLARQADIAPTAAALLGISIPAHNQGMILFDQLEMPAALKAARAADLVTQISRRYDSMLAAIGDSRRVDPAWVAQVSAALASGDDAGAVTQAQQGVESAYALWETARADRINRERLAHLPIAIVILIPFVLYFVWWRRSGWNWRAPLIGALLYFVIWNAIYFLLNRNAYSISMFNVESNIVGFITGRVIEAVIALLAATVVVAILRCRAPLGEVARDAVHTLLLVMFALVVQLLIYYVLWEIFPNWYLPDLYWAFKYYLDLYQTSAFWPLLPLPAALILPLLALLVAAIARRLIPARV